jgi:YHS domain-containing protein
MIRLFLLSFRFLFLILIVLWIFRLLSGLLRTFSGANRPPQGTPRGGAPRSSVAATELRKDPICGTYVSPDAAVTRVVKGRTVYFCSSACSERFPG